MEFSLHSRSGSPSHHPLIFNQEVVTCFSIHAEPKFSVKESLVKPHEWANEKTSQRS